MAHTRIKICGITRPEDARAAVESGADAIGLVFYSKSPRAVTVAQASACASAVGPLTTVVALFVNEPPENITRILNAVPVDVIQFHGDEPAEFCQQFSRPYLKALRMKPGVDIAAAFARYDSARGILLDTFQDGVPGGTGKTFDWTRVQGQETSRLVLAGGLSAENVGDAVHRVQPAAVDVSGGVEQSPGVKDHKAIKDFIAAVRAADQRLDGQKHE